MPTIKKVNNNQKIANATDSNVDLPNQAIKT